ncbi:MAG: T9SS type A sorting domain-containing protein [Bacteroidetes bacterium]|nr:T9SS type A sorting domain-containing protein [Bacteroidota bacterium]
MMTQTFGGIVQGRQARLLRDGGLIMGGWTSNNKPYVVRTRSNGSLGWGKEYSIGLSTLINDIQQTTDGGFIMVGTYNWSPLVGIHGPVGSDIFVMKTDPNGNPTWCRRLRGNSEGHSEQGVAIDQTKDGGYIVCGNYGVDDYLIRLSSNGTLLWNTYFYWNKARGMQQTSDSGFIVCGYSEDMSGTSKDATLLKTDKNGNLQWLKGYGASDVDEQGISVHQTANGGYIMVGTSGSNMYAVRTNGSGVPTWQYKYGSDEGDIANDVRELPNGTFIVGGQYAGNRACLMKIDPSGGWSWTRAYGKVDKDSRFFYVGLYANGFIGAGESNGFYHDAYADRYAFYAVRTDLNGNVDCNVQSVTWSATPVTGTYQKTPFPGNDCIQDSPSVTVPPIETKMWTGCYRVLPLSATDLTINDIRVLNVFGLITTGQIADQQYAAEPNQVGGHMWTSDGIWNRVSQDAVIGTRDAGNIYEHEQSNQSPVYNGASNYLYVAVENAGDLPSGPANLEVYWSKTSTAPVWTGNWLGYAIGGQPAGGLAGTIALPSIAGGDVYIAEIPWTPTDPALYGETQSSYSYLARIVSAGDPMAFPEGANTETNAYNNNNIAWRNDIIVANDEMQLGNLTGTKHVIVRNASESPAPVNLEFSVPAEELGINELFSGGGHVIVDLGPVLYAAWHAGGSQGVNVIDNGNQTVTLTADDAQINNMTMSAGEEHAIGVRFECSSPSSGDPVEYHYDMVQTGGNGNGATFDLEFPVVNPAPLDRRAVTGTDVLAGASMVALPNPTGATATVSVRLASDEEIRVAIYDITGREVRTLVPRTILAAGTHGFVWDGTDAAGGAVASGFYMLRLESARGVITSRLQMVR